MDERNPLVQFPYALGKQSPKMEEEETLELETLVFLESIEKELEKKPLREFEGFEWVSSFWKVKVVIGVSLTTT